MMDEYDKYYRTLEVSQDADKADLKKAYHRLSLKYHPDQNPDDESTKKFIQIKEAYDILIRKPQVYRGVIDTSWLSKTPQNTMSFRDALYREQEIRTHSYRRKDDVQPPVITLYKRKKKKPFNPERFLDSVAVVTTNVVSFFIPFVVLGCILYLLYWLHDL